MKILRTLSVAFAALVLAFASSCSNEKEENTNEFSIPLCYEYATDLQLGPTASYTGLNYVVSINYVKMSANVTVSGLRLPDGTAFPTFVIPDLDLKLNDQGWLKATGKERKIQISSVSGGLNLTNIEMGYFARHIGQELAPGYYLKFTAANRYRILSGQTQVKMTGDTESVNTVTGSEFETDASTYVVDINPELGMLNITIVRAQFSADMPNNLTITLPNIPYTVDEGKMKFGIASLIPTFGGDPFPAFPISNLDGELDLEEGLELEFGCTFRGTLYRIDVDTWYHSTEVVE